MKIFDCFMYFDEELILEIRLNTLDKYVDYFVIVEASFNHKGENRELLFNHEKFKKFRNKIIYLVLDTQPKNIENVNENDSENTKSRKYIMNAVYRENGQRNKIMDGLSQAKNEDIIMVSDVDEIPKLENVSFSKISEKIILFKQDMFYYKLNLTIPNFKWTGTKACKYRNLKSPQWLRNIKDRKYSFYRLDTILSETKYISINIVEDGGWHFSNIKTPAEIEHKLRSYLHHREFDLASLTIDEIAETVKNKTAIYDLTVDKTVNKVGNGKKLVIFDINKLPDYIKQNTSYLNKWID